MVRLSNTRRMLHPALPWNSRHEIDAKIAIRTEGLGACAGQGVSALVGVAKEGARSFNTHHGRDHLQTCKSQRLGSNPATSTSGPAAHVQVGALVEVRRRRRTRMDTSTVSQPVPRGPAGNPSAWIYFRAPSTSACVTRMVLGHPKAVASRTQ